jgi:hypothetical protein
MGDSGSRRAPAAPVSTPRSLNSLTKGSGLECKEKKVSAGSAIIGRRLVTKTWERWVLAESDVRG